MPVVNGLKVPPYKAIVAEAPTIGNRAWGSAMTSPHINCSNLRGDMVDTLVLIRGFAPKLQQPLPDLIARHSQMLFVGEGSSSLFPGAVALDLAELSRTEKNAVSVVFSSAETAGDYPQHNRLIVATSNSGETKETYEFMQANFPEGLSGPNAKNSTPVVITAHPEERIAQLLKPMNVIGLACGSERVVAATKSTVEQALYHQYIVAISCGREVELFSPEKMCMLTQAFGKALFADIDPAISWLLAGAKNLYVGGNIPGVPGEIRQKAVEILGTPGIALPSTLVFHGEQEVMAGQDAAVYFAPNPNHKEKLLELKRSTQTPIIIVCLEDELHHWKSDGPSKDHKDGKDFFTIPVPSMDREFMPYVYLAAGWNALVNGGVAKNRNIDLTEKATKIGYK